MYDREGNRTRLGEFFNNALLSLPLVTTAQTVYENREEIKNGAVRKGEVALAIGRGALAFFSPGTQRALIASQEGANLGWVAPAFAVDVASNFFLLTHTFMQNPSWGSFLFLVGARTVSNFIIHEAASGIEEYGYQRLSRRISRRL